MADREKNGAGPHPASPERLLLSDALNNANNAQIHMKWGLGTPSVTVTNAGELSREAERAGDEHEPEMHTLRGPTLSETMQLKTKAMEDLVEAKSEICVERELNRRLERKVRILEKAIVEVRDESEGLRSALMAALDRLAMFSSNSVPAGGLVSKSSTNWLEVHSRSLLTYSRSLLTHHLVATLVGLF